MTLALLLTSGPLAANEQKRQAMAIAAITKLGGRVDQDEKAPG
jgi:hypothetical protein